MHIAVLNQFHQMPGSGGLARFAEMARHWKESGCDVTIVCSTIDHASGLVPNTYRRGRLHSENGGGARVLRTWTYAGNKARSSGRILRDLSFAASARYNGAHAVRDADVVVASSPPLFVGVPGARLAARHRRPFVFEVRDLWPDIPVEFGALKGPAARLAYRLEDWVYRKADHIVGVTPGIVQRIQEKGVPAERLSMIPNGADLDAFSPRPDRAALRARYGWTDSFIVLYAGVHGPAQALDQLVRTAERIRDVKDVRFVLVGAGSEKAALVDQARRLGLHNIDFRDQRPREEIAAMMAAADIGIATLKDVPSFRYLYPAKIFEVLASYPPIVLAAQGVARELVEASGGGITAAPEDDASIEDAIRKLHADPRMRREMGEGGRAYVHEHFDRKKIASDYLRILEGCLS